MTDFLRAQLSMRLGYATARSAQAGSSTQALRAINQAYYADLKKPRLNLHLTSVNPWSELSALECSLYGAVSLTDYSLNHSSAAPWSETTALNLIAQGGHHVAGVAIDAGIETYISTPLAVLDKDLFAPQLSVELYAYRPSEYDLLAREMLLDLSTVIDLDDAVYIPSSLIEWGSMRLTDLPASPIYSGVQVAVKQPLNKDKDLIAPWGISSVRAYSVDTPYKTDPPPIEPGKVPEPEAKKVHIVVNSISVVALPDREPLAVSGVAIDADLDTYSWKLTCQVLNEGSMALLRPTAAGDKELEVTINNHKFRFFVATCSAARRIDDDKLTKTWRISAYSRSQYLAAPYAPKRTRSVSTTTAVQAAEAELFGTGFVLDWNTDLLPDWPMPNASFSYQSLTPLEVIKRIASAVGAVVLADPFFDKIYVRPRHKVMAWALLEADMDRTIHESQLLSDSNQRVQSPAFNAVVVAGETEGKVLEVKRFGTAGDNPAPDITDAFLTDTVANAARGAQELSLSGDRMEYTYELAIPESNGQPGLLIPGLTVAVMHEDPTENFRAYVQSVAINAAGDGNASITQTINLSRPLAWEVE